MIYVSVVLVCSEGCWLGSGCCRDLTTGRWKESEIRALTGAEGQDYVSS
jgi:hypothetical protein